MVRRFYSNVFLFIYCVSVVAASSSLLSCSNDSGDGSPVDASWTIMFYANGDNNLENSILSDLKEMELSPMPEHITIIALVDRPSAPSDKFGAWPDTKLFRVVHGTDESTLSSEEIASEELSLTIAGTEELDMCNASVLAEFIGYCKSEYPSDRYALIIGSHGDGWIPPSSPVFKSIGYDSTSHNTSAGIAALASALKANPPDVLIFDACNMGNIETLYELMGSADYVVASPNPLPLSGFNYTDVISGLGADSTPENFALQFSLSWKKINDDTAMMVYSMKDFFCFMNCTVSGSSYIGALSAASLSNPDRAIAARNNSIRYSVNGISDHIDIADYSENLIPENNIPFRSFIITAYKPMLSFYFPSDPAGFETDYYSTAFAKDTAWDETLENVLQ